MPYLRTLAGLGIAFGNPDLTLIMDDSGIVDMHRRTSGVDFLADCDTYYHMPFDVRWDRNGDGTFESAGSAVDFDATAVDGPAAFSIPVRATHPVGGSALNASAAVSVVNVPPAIAGFKVANSAGQRIGVDVMFAPRPDTAHSERVVHRSRPCRHPDGIGELGDSVVENQTTFSSFTQATGGQTGSLSATHRYTASGDYTLQLLVRDKDGGEDVESMTLRVLTPAEALQEVLVRLDAAIAAAPGGAMRAALREGPARAGGARSRGRWRASDARRGPPGRGRRIRPAGNRPAPERALPRCECGSPDRHAAAGIHQPDSSLTWEAA